MTPEQRAKTSTAKSIKRVRNFGEGRGMDGVWRDDCRAAIAELDRLRQENTRLLALVNEAEVAELRRDKERLDWLETYGFETHGPLTARVVGWRQTERGRLWTVTFIGNMFESARVAIDAAREGR